jgi:diaminopimelate epimerase
MRFSKWHGLGNDYLLVQRADIGSALTAEQVRKLCDYHFGVGSDGVLEVVSADGGAESGPEATGRAGEAGTPSIGAAESAPSAEVVIWNPDGSTAELSGNGTRIAARWLARRSGARTVRIRVGDREVVARMRDGLQVEMDLGAVEVGEPEQLAVAGETLEFTPASVGNPHAVVRLEPERPMLLRLGPLIENHERFPGRTNVQLVRVDGPNELTVGVWERGAGETLSSGTSAVACAAVAVARGWCESPVTVHLAGGDLVVELNEEGSARLTGPAQEIFAGETSEEFE